ncbi:MAG: hypothetical protein R6U43_05275 [Candidatus Krumholzibacteriales bacterium]
MSPTRFQIAKKDIVNYFEELEENILTHSDISDILFREREFWRLPKNMTSNSFIDTLIRETKLQMHRFEFPYRPSTIYSWGDVSEYQLYLSLKPNSYFSHYTAMYLHNLTDQIPKNVYINSEQSPKPQQRGKLLQANINKAFSRPQRTTNNITTYNEHKIYMLSGKYTDNLGVTKLKTEDNGNITVTNIERTLIDIVVRPIYSGGIYEVLNAYKAAKGKVSINKIVAYLSKLKYKYPYHQSIGFLLETTLYDESKIELLMDFDISNKFYLSHQMKDKAFSEKWQLYYPKGMIS